MQDSVQSASLQVALKTSKHLSLVKYFVFFVALVCISFGAKADESWQDVSASLSINVSKPIRSRRSPDAKINVEIKNTGEADLKSPLRFVLGDLSPDGVSLKEASGTNADGDPFLDLTPFIGEKLGAGESSGVFTLNILGGRKIFSFSPKVEQQQAQEPSPLIVQITEPDSLITVGASPIEVKGTINDPDAELTVNGDTVDHTGGRFSALVSLEEGLNNIVARVVKDGSETTDSIVVSLDTTPPYITIEDPVDGGKVYQSSISVSGLVNDIVRGTISEDDANVTVNGVAATVSNRSYLAQNIQLKEGANTITVKASDGVGNVNEAAITIHYEVPKPKRIELVSGQDQKAPILTKLSEPLVVKLLEGNGDPAVNKNVIFRVIQGDGLLAPGTDDEAQGILVQSDDEGLAKATFKLGSRAGNGNHRVRARAVGFDGEVVFHASGETLVGDKISIIDGNNQRGAVNRPLTKPLIVAVTDAGTNLVSNAEVEFVVTKGGGSFQNGRATYTTKTDADGRASAELTLGPDVGLDVQRVTAKLVGTLATAGFTASGLEVGDPGQTIITGVVLDNQDNPVPGVTVRVDGTTREAVADDQGLFKITEVPVGPVHLLADGSTATVDGEWPTLSYNLVTIAGTENPLPAPIYMVKLDTDNAQVVGEKDVEYTLPEVPGFRLTVKAGSVTFPDGSKSGKISVTPVNANKVPMAPPNGMQPQFIVTIQPHGVRFDPPAPLTLPNVDGHPPGAQVEMYSYDHDLEEFVTIGLGTVTADGSLIESNRGVGVIKGGWHCGSQPGGSGCAHNCNYCEECTKECNCELVIDRPKQEQDPNDCKILLCGGGFLPASEVPNVADIPNDCKKPVCLDGSPGFSEDPNDLPLDIKGDCRIPVCNGENPIYKIDLNDLPSEICKVCSEKGEVIDDPECPLFGLVAEDTTTVGSNNERKAMDGGTLNLVVDNLTATAKITAILTSGKFSNNEPRWRGQTSGGDGDTSVSYTSVVRDSTITAEAGALSKSVNVRVHQKGKMKGSILPGFSKLQGFIGLMDSLNDEISFGPKNRFKLESDIGNFDFSKWKAEKPNSPELISDFGYDVGVGIKVTGRISHPTLSGEFPPGWVPGDPWALWEVYAEATGSIGVKVEGETLREYQPVKVNLVKASGEADVSLKAGAYVLAKVKGYFAEGDIYGSTSISYTVSPVKISPVTQIDGQYSWAGITVATTFKLKKNLTGELISAIEFSESLIDGYKQKHPDRLVDIDWSKY